MKCFTRFYIKLVNLSAQQGLHLVGGKSRSVSNLSIARVKCVVRRRVDLQLHCETFFYYLLSFADGRIEEAP